jgi:pimeloyl-ACP methyl ester carboxylesterase
VPVLGDPASPVKGLAPYLAGRGIDVWGVDRRWTLPGTDDDVTDFGTMGVAQEIDDIRAALAIARALRGGDKLALMGFSHGGQLAYAYAAVEGQRPAAQRHVDALVPIDYYGDYGPEDEEVRVATCGYATDEYGFVADGFTDIENGFIIGIGARARSAPNDPSPLPPYAGMTNREAFVSFIGQTYFVAPFAPFYHLGAPLLDGDVAVGLAASSEAAMSAWLAGGTPHQALLETADLDRLLCGEGTMPVNAPLSAIRVPLYYLGAAGGIGANGLHATTQVSSTDRTVNMVQRYAAGERVRDFGHTDLLLAADAQTLAWAPLASWLLHH